MKFSLKKIASLLMPLLLGIFLVYIAFYQFSTAQLQEIKSHFANANYTYIILATALSWISLASRAYRWKFTLQQLGYQSTFGTNMAAICIGYLLNLTVPRSGEFSRALVLKKYNNIPFDKAFGTIVAERIIDLIVLILCMMIALLAQFDTLKDFLEEKIPIQQILILLSIITIGFALIVFIFKYSKWKLVLFIKEKISGLWEGLSSVFLLKNKWWFLFHTFVIWASYILTFYIAIFALKETATISFGVVITAFVVGSIAISFTNGGLGAFPIVIAGILSLYQVPETAGTAFGWILWGSQTLFVVVLGGLSFIILPFLKNIKN